MKHNDYIVSIGGSNIDIQGFAKNKLILKESNIGNISVCPGGVERNIVDNLSRIGFKNIKFITSVGDDVFGDILFNNIKTLGIDINYIVKGNNINTTSYIAIIDESSDMAIAMSDMDSLDLLVTVEYLETLRGIIEESKLIVLDAVLSRDIFLYLFETFPSKRIVCDAVSIKKAEHIKGIEKNIYALKLNSNEASFLLDRSIIYIDDGKKAVKDFINIGVESVYITFGASGICFGSREYNPDFFPVPYVDVANTSGAGDSFTAGIVYGVLNNYDILDIVKFASVMSIITLQSKHTVSEKMSLSLVEDILKNVYKK